MTTLRDARQKGKIDQFIKEHEVVPPGDMDKLDAAISRPAKETEKEGREASKPGSGDG